MKDGGPSLAVGRGEKLPVSRGAGLTESSNKRGFVRDWAEGMISQICSFPEGTAHDDFVDAMSQGLRYLRDAGWLTIDYPKDWLDEDDYADADKTSNKRRGNPYDQ
jgi:hypothetical protein